MFIFQEADGFYDTERKKNQLTAVAVNHLHSLKTFFQEIVRYAVPKGLFLTYGVVFLGINYLYCFLERAYISGEIATNCILQVISQPKYHKYYLLLYLRTLSDNLLKNPYFRYHLTSGIWKGLLRLFKYFRIKL